MILLLKICRDACGAWSVHGLPPVAVSQLPSLSASIVVGRFCGITLFFTCWAVVRHWPHPIHYLSNMLKVAFGVCTAFALIRRKQFADVNLNCWDESLAYIATAVLLDCLPG